MYKILKKLKIGTHIKEMDIYAPSVAAKAEAGQFLIVRLTEVGERIPLTISKKNEEKGIITIVFQEVGKTTQELGNLKPGDLIKDVLGPLGKPSKVEKYGNVVCIGGGVGIGAIYPIAKALKGKGNNVFSIIGSRSKDLVILEDEMRDVSLDLYITTNDGSYGTKGFVTDILKEIISKEKIDYIFAVGPTPMLKAVFKVASKYKIKTRVSLESLMLDGIGMCGACRFEFNGKTVFTCVDGPEFDAYGVNFDDIINRNKK